MIFGFNLHNDERCIPIVEPSRSLWSVRAAAAGLHSRPFSQPPQASILYGSQSHVELSARPRWACWTRASLSHLEPLDRSSLETEFVQGTGGAEGIAFMCLGGSYLYRSNYSFRIIAARHSWRITACKALRAACGGGPHCEPGAPWAQRTSHCVIGKLCKLPPAL